MQKSSATFLQAILVLIGVAALALLIWMPRAEGVNAHATSFAEIYLDDPFLAYCYLAAIPFFWGLTRAFLVLGHAGRGAFSPATAQALRTLKVCAIAVIAFVAGAEIIILMQESDDAAGGVMMGLFIAVAASVVCAAAAMFERMVRERLNA